jgi:hypothetical protein
VALSETESDCHFDVQKLQALPRPRRYPDEVCVEETIASYINLRVAFAGVPMGLAVLACGNSLISINRS